MADTIRLALSQAWDALKRLKDFPEKLALSVLCDTLFFVAYGFIFNDHLFPKLIDYVTVVGSVVSENAPDITRGASNGISGIIMDNPQASAALNQVFILYIIIAVAIYAIYTFFQGVSWKMSADISGKDYEFYKFMKRFALMNIFWIVLFSANHMLSLFSDMRNSALQTFEMGEGQILPLAVKATYFAIFYFAFISYAMIGTKKEGIKNAFRIGVSKLACFIPACALVAAAYFALDKVVTAIGSYGFSLMMIAGVFIMMPMLAWARVYITAMSNKS